MGKKVDKRVGDNTSFQRENSYFGKALRWTGYSRNNDEGD
jgi:hypothetical protein